MFRFSEAILVNLRSGGPLVLRAVTTSQWLQNSMFNASVTSHCSQVASCSIYLAMYVSVWPLKILYYYTLFTVPSIIYKLFSLQHGLMRTADEEYFIEPLEQYSSINLYSEGHPHIVYKRSSLPRPANSHDHHGHDKDHKNYRNYTCEVKGQWIWYLLVCTNDVLSMPVRNFVTIFSCVTESTQNGVPWSCSFRKRSLCFTLHGSLPSISTIDSITSLASLESTSWGVK